MLYKETHSLELKREFVPDIKKVVVAFANTVPASENAIRKMIKETDGDKFEEIRSFYQELTFEVAIKEFKNWEDH